MSSSSSRPVRATGRTRWPATRATRCGTSWFQDAPKRLEGGTPKLCCSVNDISAPRLGAASFTRWLVTISTRAGHSSYAASAWMTNSRIRIGRSSSGVHAGRNKTYAPHAWQRTAGHGIGSSGAPCHAHDLNCQRFLQGSLARSGNWQTPSVPAPGAALRSPRPDPMPRRWARRWP